jgi:hypothetical protein
MIVRAITLCIEKDENKKLRQLYEFRQTGKFYDNYLRWNDGRFLFVFGENGPAKSVCTELLHRLLERQLFKRVFYASAKEFAAECKEGLMNIEKPQNEAQRKLIESDH